MPYARNRRLRSRRPRRNFRRNKRNSVSFKANKAYALSKRLTRSIERKYSTTHWTETKSAADGWQVYNLTELAQGISASQRIGNEVTLKSVHLKGFLETTGSYAVPQAVRMVIVQTMQQVPDTDPSVSTLLYDTSYIASPYAYPSYRKYYKVLSDQIINLGPFNANQVYNGTTTSAYGFNKPHWINKWINPKVRNIRWNGPNTTDEEKNQVYMFLGFQASSNEAVNIDLFSQISYTDL